MMIGQLERKDEHDGKRSFAPSPLGNGDCVVVNFGKAGIVHGTIVSVNYGIQQVRFDVRLEISRDADIVINIPAALTGMA